MEVGGRRQGVDDAPVRALTVVLQALPGERGSGVRGGVPATRWKYLFCKPGGAGGRLHDASTLHPAHAIPVMPGDHTPLHVEHHVPFEYRDVAWGLATQPEGRPDRG
jgi:hypothetical protein